jgi:hypothetical protein
MASSHERSKKQSAGSRRRPLTLPEDFVLYLDENLHNCKPILDALVQYDVRYERHGQHFAAGTEDTEWLPFVGEKGWALLTKDKRIRYNELEKAAVRQHKIREFYFSSGNYSGSEMAEMLINALRDMGRIFRKQKPPFIASISKSGKAEIRLK